jgi:GNAT superfamily N-acetyltransferase
MQVRPAAEADLPAIARVQARTMVAADHYPDSVDEESEYRRLVPRVSGYFRGSYDPQCALAERVLFVAECEGEIVGFIAGHRSTRRGCNAELEWLFVLPHWQRQGVGGRLLQPLREWFTARNSTRVIVDAPPANPSRAFYLKHGAIPLDGPWLYWKDIAGPREAERLQPST